MFALVMLLQLVGTWTRSDGSTMTVPCPVQADFEDVQSTIRLPVGCPILGPRIGYTVDQDAQARAELKTLRAQVPLLQDELSRGRTASDALVADLRTQLTAEQQAHDAANTQAAEASGRAAQAQAQLTSRGVLFGSVGVAVGALVALYLAR